MGHQIMSAFPLPTSSQADERSHLVGQSRGLRPYQWGAVGSDVTSAVVGIGASATVWDLALGDIFSSFVACGVLIFIWVLALGFSGAYDVRQVGRGIQEYKRVVAAGVVTLGLVVALAFFMKEPVSRGFVLLTFAVGILLMLTGRWGLRRWLLRARAKGRFQRNVWVIGEADQLAEVTRLLEADGAREYRIVGSAAEPHQRDALPRWLDRQIEALQESGADTVAVATSSTDPELVQAVAWRIEGPGISLLVSPALGRLVGSRISVHQTAGVPFLSLDEPRLIGAQRLVKRALDILGALLLLILLSPVMVASAFAVRASGAGPILYTQNRVGRNGELFTFPKFRTMAVGAESMRADVIGTPDRDIAARYKSDPRITPVGRFLRRWSLDELPQLFNVFVGSMSLVGPRPMLPEEIDLLAGADHRRHVAQPGLTGLWQVNGRKETTWEERVSLDLDYIDKWSPLLDLIIMARTLAAIVSARGAY